MSYEYFICFLNLTITTNNEQNIYMTFFRFVFLCFPYSFLIKKKNYSKQFHQYFGRILYRCLLTLNKTIHFLLKILTGLMV